MILDYKSGKIVNANPYIALTVLAYIVPGLLWLNHYSSWALLSLFSAKEQITKSGFALLDSITD